MKALYNLSSPVIDNELALFLWISYEVALAWGSMRYAVFTRVAPRKGSGLRRITRRMPSFLTPKDVLALGHRVTTEQDGLELTFQDPIFGEAVLSMATHGHISRPGTLA